MTDVERCPDQLYAREVAKTLLRALVDSRRHDEAVGESRRLRARFDDGAFGAHALLMEGRAWQGRGRTHYPMALAAFRQVMELRPDSPEARQARTLSGRMGMDAMGDDLFRIGN